MANPNNLAIWEQVFKTDPDMTEKINFGAFKFTTIDSMYQVQRITELFGPCGQGWGTRNERFTPIVADPTDAHYTLLCYQAEFWYIYDGKEGKQEIAADIELFENTKNGWKRVTDPVKKVRTAALSKGISWLGFNADVFLGKFDDARYVNELKQEKQREQQKPKSPAGNGASQAQRDEIDTLRKRLRIKGTEFTDWLAGYDYTWQTLTLNQAIDVIEMLTKQLADEQTRREAAGASA